MWNKLVTGDHVTGGHVTGDHVTGDHVTGGHVTGDHVTGNHVTGGHVTGGHVTGDHVTTIDQSSTRVFASLREAVDWCTVNRHKEHSPQQLRDSEHVQVLVTGSLHLVGAFMTVLDIKVDES